MASLLIINIDGKKCQIPIPDNRPADQLLKVRGTDVACPICQRLFSQHTWQEFDHFDQPRQRALKKWKIEHGREV